jgi:hypothetical protein
VRRATVAIAMLVAAGMSCNKIYLPGDTPLPHGILVQNYSSMSGMQFETLVNSINWVDGNTRDRCTNDACTTKVAVRIDANESSYTIDSLNPGAEGTLVARVRNMGGDTAYMYHFKPAPYRYFFLVRRSGGGPTRWILLQQVAGSAPDSVAGGPFRGCWDHPAATSAHADFRDCGARISSTFQEPLVAALPTSTRAPLARQSLGTHTIEVGSWIGCAYGCCPLTY